MPLIPALRGRGRRISEFKASLLYRVSSRTARDTQRKICLENKKYFGEKRRKNKNKNKEREREREKEREKERRRRGREQESPTDPLFTSDP